MNTTQRLVVVPHETIGTISPYLHGHFSEHLGECIYPGLCVPPGCAIPNTGGLRHDVIAALKPLNIPVLRWPGGCFADDYHWRDGIGPKEQRPLRLNRHWGQTPESGAFGTHEFMEFCRAIGSEPYFAGNVGSGTPAELSDWVEYCNYAGSSALADERRAKMLFDEWGAWHPVEQGRPASGLYQQNTVRDACVAALSLDVFHNHADKIWMANIAQLVNVLQAVLLVEEDKCLKTPTYHVFDLYQPHKGATAVRLESLAEPISDGGIAAHYCRTRYRDARRFNLRAIHGSASVKDGVLCVTAVNTHSSESVELEVELYRAGWSEVEAVYLEAEGIRAMNTFERPDAVELSAPCVAQVRDGVARVELPPGGIVRLQGLIC